MYKEYVDDKNKERLVLKKSLWPTICSGDKKNDIQFPNFDLEIDTRQEVLQNQI